MRRTSIPLIALLLMGSGTCALIYQVAWFREFHLIFGSTTSSTAAVVAIFMGGLGIGNAVLGKRADRKQNPLAFYARLELLIAAIVALTPLLIAASRWAYISLGGQLALGPLGATVLRLALSALVILLPTILMGGTLPAAVAAATTKEDVNRRAAGLLYGCNTLGAVVGTLASTFLLLSWLGTRTTLWAACVLNLAVASLAALLARSIRESKIESGESVETIRPSTLDPRLSTLDSRPGYVYAAAAIVGFGFMLMELVWYRMLSPILGGTTYTFGLILALALLGIGIGGALYPVLFNRRFSPSLGALALTCGLEAVAIAFPFALGDWLALQTALLHAANQSGFIGEILNWSKIAGLIVLPASIVSGVQFPLLLALLGRAKKDVGKQLGYTYVANTGGSIIGSLAGGFGLLPLLSAPGAWRLVAALLAGLSLVLSLLALLALWRSKRTEAVQPEASPDSTPAIGNRWMGALTLNLGIVLAAVLMINATGPTAFWRHSGIGAGQALIPQPLTPNSITNWQNGVRLGAIYQIDGVEAGMALMYNHSLGFFINGKSDGNAIANAPTQIGLGILPALLHPEPKTCMVIGLGTGETAGWLGLIPSIDHVDVVEIEPAVDEMARRCASVAGDVLNNPKVRVIYNDAREVLLTVNSQYDIIASAPSNPYRAGIANLFTREFYQSIKDRLKPKGIFAQWLQGYEIDQSGLATVLATLKSEFKFVEIWQTSSYDFLFVCSQQPIRHDIEDLRKRIAQEPYRSALANAWRAYQVEGILSHYVGGDVLSESLAKDGRDRLNTDDLNYLEYGFARSLGNQLRSAISEFREKAKTLAADRPALDRGNVDWEGVAEERMAMYAMMGDPISLPPDASPEQQARCRALQQYQKNNYAAMIAEWESQPRQPVYRTETALLALAYAELGNEKADELIRRLQSYNKNEADLIRGILLFRQGKTAEASEVLARTFTALRADPWPIIDVAERALAASREIAAQFGAPVEKLLQAVEKPFAVMFMENSRRWSGFLMASNIDSKAMIPWIGLFEPNVPWTKPFLRLRAEAYNAVGHPLAQQAEKDLDLFQKQETQ